MWAEFHSRDLVREVESKILKDERVNLDEISQPDVRALVAGYLVAGSQVEKLL